MSSATRSEPLARHSRAAERQPRSSCRTRAAFSVLLRKTQRVWPAGEGRVVDGVGWPPGGRADRKARGGTARSGRPAAVARSGLCREQHRQPAAARRAAPGPSRRLRGRTHGVEPRRPLDGCGARFWLRGGAEPSLRRSAVAHRARRRCAGSDAADRIQSDPNPNASLPASHRRGRGGPGDPRHIRLAHAPRPGGGSLPAAIWRVR